VRLLLDGPSPGRALAHDLDGHDDRGLALAQGLRDPLEFAGQVVARRVVPSSNRGATHELSREMVRAVRDAISAKLGVCPFCMRASARGALAAWRSTASDGRWGRGSPRRPGCGWLLLAAAWAFTLLIAAHLVAYMCPRRRLHCDATHGRAQ
jgi:hypothetical protein